MPSAPANPMDQVFKALAKGDIDRALSGLQGLDVNATNKKGLTPLIGGIHSADDGFVQALVEELGADPNQCSADGTPPLVHCVMHNNVQAFRILNQLKGLNREAMDPNGRAAIHWAAELGSTALLQQMGSPNLLKLKTSEGNTALMHAIETQQEEAALWLLAKCSDFDVNATNAQGDGALHLSIGNKMGPVSVGLINSSDIQLNLKGENGNTPLHVAHAVESTIFIKKLVQAGADESAVNDDGLTPAGITEDRKRATADEKKAKAQEKQQRIANKANAKAEEMDSSEITLWLRDNGFDQYVQAMYDRSFRTLEHLEDACKGRPNQVAQELKKGGISKAEDRDRIVELINALWQSREEEEAIRLEEEAANSQKSITKSRILFVVLLIAFFVGVYFVLQYLVDKEQAAVHQAAPTSRQPSGSANPSRGSSSTEL